MQTRKQPFSMAGASRRRYSGERRGYVTSTGAVPFLRLRTGFRRPAD